MVDVSEKHMEVARDVLRSYLCRIKYDRRACFEHDELMQEMISAALANAERDGMKRAAEIARAAGQTHLDFAALGLPIEPSKIIAEDRARIANKIADRILSEAGSD